MENSAIMGPGTFAKSQGGQYFLLHDGRATSIEDAILLHGGEAEAAKNGFNMLNEAEKQKLIKFLKSL